MKRLVGGDYLLDLSSIELEESEDGTTKTNITDSDVLEQLTNLKKYIKNPEMAKPVWVKLVNGENDELVIARGTFAVVDTGEFEICVQLDGYKLVIFIEFTQATLSDDTPIDDWYIDTNDAKYLFTSDAQNIGAITELPIFENIVDANGHKRFIDGDGIPATSITGFSSVFCKWSLSGSHLMFVLAGKFDADSSISGQPVLATFRLPQWILDKIYPVWGGVNIETKKIIGRDDNWTENTFDVVLQKYPVDETSECYFALLDSPFAPEQDVNFRIEFDLLIDNEPEQAGE